MDPTDHSYQPRGIIVYQSVLWSGKRPVSPTADDVARAIDRFCLAEEVVRAIDGICDTGSCHKVAERRVVNYYDLPPLHPGTAVDLFNSKLARQL